MKQRNSIRAATFLCLVWVANISPAASTSAAKYLDQPQEWYRSEEASRIAANVLSYQAATGGWPKNVDTATKPYAGDSAALHATYDNKSTTDELRFLGRICDATHEARYSQAFIRGLDYVLKGQYPNGGWPQFYPPDSKYDRYITYNDGAMARLMFFIREVANDPIYSFVDEARRKACSEAFDRGIQCILKCQIKVDGKLTVWCAQHDEKDFTPRPARTYELVSLSGSESVGVVHVLMSVEKPTPEIVQAVDGAVAWFDSARLKGIRVQDRPHPGKSKGFERIVVDDPAAPDMWARFYEIGTNQPIFSDRDGIAKHQLSEIGDERRNGYRWLGYWPQNLIEKEYPAWKARHVGNGATTHDAAGSNVPRNPPAPQQ